MKRTTFGREPLLAEIHGFERFIHDRRAENEEQARLRLVWFQVLMVALLDAGKRPASGAGAQERCDAARAWLKGGPDRDLVCDLAGISPETLDRAMPALRASWLMADAGHQPKRRHLAQVPFAWGAIAMITSKTNDLQRPVMRRMLAEGADRTQE